MAEKKPGDQKSVEEFLHMIAWQTANDAEKRSKPTTITYRIAWGAGLRKRLQLDVRRKAILLSVLVFVFVAFGYLVFKVLKPETDINIWLGIWLSCGSLLLVFATFLIPADTMYLDRLSFILPGSNFLFVEPKVLWSKIEEVKLIDLAKNGEASKFALRLIEPAGEEHDILIDSLEREELPILASYIRSYAPHARGLAQLAELERFHDYQMRKLEGVSYTQLWESGALIQFGLTSFTPLEPGTVLQGRFKVLKQIAAGGFSAVYLIGDDDGQTFVLKESVVPPNLDEALKEKAVEQFAREAKLLSRLDHPQIARVYDHFVEDNRSYLRIEYIDGPNLRKHVGESKAQLESTVQKWVEELAEILAYLHELTPPVVHRDLSPDNVVIRPGGRLVLIDFGAANEFIGQATGTLVGKHAYMAPEQIRGNAEPISDLYSLGACAFFCMTGRDPEPIRTCSPNAVASGTTSEWFDAFVKRATALDQESRFQTARQCLEYLKKPQAPVAGGSPEQIGES